MNAINQQRLVARVAKLKASTDRLSIKVNGYALDPRLQIDFVALTTRCAVISCAANALWGDLMDIEERGMVKGAWYGQDGDAPAQGPALGGRADDQ